jgi:hypothetical protein
VATPTFIYLRYRYAAMAVSVMILLQMHLIAPGNDEPDHRTADRYVGAPCHRPSASYWPTGNTSRCHGW